MHIYVQGQCLCPGPCPRKIVSVNSIFRQKTSTPIRGGGGEGGEGGGETPSLTKQIFRKTKFSPFLMKGPFHHFNIIFARYGNLN